MDELQLRVVIHFDVSTIESDLSGTRDAVATLLITNADEIDDLRSALRSRTGQHVAVVRWRSPDDNPALQQSVRHFRTPNGT
ncbi:MAG: hypothetical protein HOV67_18650 [Kribbellaceae bacterium]|nr:hypothetical protein [Kribbellaceae bacterium]